MPNNITPNENSLAKVWPHVQAFLDNGISIIPVRDKEELYNGVLYGPKTPCLRDWKQYQSTRPTKEELWYNTERANTTGFAFICGRVSGNLFAIDVDEKFRVGTKATLLKDIHRYNPDLYDRLRIHGTPSGGAHIIYRILGDKVPGNEKLASRNPTTDELTTDPKNKKPKAFIETRGEGGYIVAPPSLGYTVHQDRPIPEITWEEHCSIINLCRSYNEVMKVEKAPTSTKHDSSYYSENPWDDFNASHNAHQVLADHGWSHKSESNKFIWFTRPGKDQGVSASWNKEKKVFYIFTSSTEFDPSTGYLPSTALAILRFGGDKKQTYRWLVDNGFGKIRPEVEKKLIKNKASQGQSLPPNASQEAIEAHKKEVEIHQEKHPHSICWEQYRGRVIINKEKFIQILIDKGYRNFNGELWKINGPFIYPSNVRELYDDSKAYIQEDDYDEYCKIADAFESLFQRSGSFIGNRLPLIDPQLILKDTKNESLKFFQNGFVSITKEQVVLRPYSECPGFVFANRVQKRDFVRFVKTQKKPLIEIYLDKALNFYHQEKYILSILGYCALEYKDEAGSYIIILTEITDDPHKGGGSGKSLFCSLLKYQTTVANIPGAQTKFDEKFMNSWNFERILSLSDVPKKFDFAFLKELSTGSGILKKLFKDEVSVSQTDMPKFIVSTNFSYEISDGGLRRRIIPLEFTDFFTKAGGVDTYFGAHFPKDWTEYDWAGFDDLVFRGIQEFMKAGCKLQSLPLSESGWLKQFDQTHGEINREFIQENIDAWVDAINVDPDTFNNQYTAYCNSNQIKFRLSPTRMNRALNDWCVKHKICFRSDFSTTKNGIKKKYKNFTRGF